MVSLQVVNLADDVSGQELEDHMRQAGEVTFAVIVEPVHCQRYGLVSYGSTKIAQKAVDTLDGTEPKGKAIFVRKGREVGQSIQWLNNGLDDLLAWKIWM